MSVLTINGRDFSVTGIQLNPEQTLDLGGLLGPVSELNSAIGDGVTAAEAAAEASAESAAEASSYAATVPGPDNVFTVETAPEVDETQLGRVIFVTDGADGQPCAAICDGVIWRQVALGAEITVGE